MKDGRPSGRMELGYAFLAKYADTAADGTFALIGGGIESFNSPAIPIGIAAITVIAHLVVEPNECGHEHRLRVNLFGPAGGVAQVAGEIGFLPALNPARPDRRVGITCILGMVGVSLPDPGDYKFRLSVDGSPIVALSFSA